MKIYFERENLSSPMVIKDSGIGGKIAYVDAGNGVDSNIENLDFFFDVNDLENNNDLKYSIYTNSLVALNNKYVWNDELGVPEIYVRCGNDDFYFRENPFCKWYRIDKLTDKNLQKSDNLIELFLSGEFDNLPETPNKCPFCDSEVQIFDHGYYTNYEEVSDWTIECKCGAEMSGFSTKHDVIKAWNKRASN